MVVVTWESDKAQNSWKGNLLKHSEVLLTLYFKGSILIEKYWAIYITEAKTVDFSNI